MSFHQAFCVRSLRRAVEVSDGPEQLAAELDLSASQLQLMLDGVSDVPEEMFLRVVDLLIDRAVAELTARGNASARFLAIDRECRQPMDETAELQSARRAEPARPPANRLSPKRASESPFKWLPVEIFKRMSAEQRETYLLEIAGQLGLH